MFKRRVGCMGINLKDFTSAFAHDSKGAGGTRAKALQTFRSLQKFAKTARWGDTTPQNITSKQLNGYLTHRSTANSARGKPLSARSVQNEAAILRRAVTGAGRSVENLSDKKNNWSNARLGVPTASRKSAKPPMDPKVFAAAREKLSPQIGVIADLQQSMGLRAQEAVKAQNVREWQGALTNAIEQNRGVYLHLTKDAASKGGRPRHIYIPPGRTDAVLTAVKAAAAAKAAGGGHILNKYDNLESAVKGYENALAYRGLTGDNSNHALRREFACNQYDHYVNNEGLDKDTALSRLSQDLGHGDGRGRWVENNYLAGRK